jgi:hypothetical protein
VRLLSEWSQVRILPIDNKQFLKPRNRRTVC